jgi:CRISPR-associated protein Cas1
MQLFIDSYGAYLGVRNKCFWVKPKENEGRLFALREVDAIFLTRGVTASTNALMLAIENEIPVLFIDAIGHPVGQVWSGQFGSIATIRKKQALFALQREGMVWVAEVLGEKLDNQLNLLGRISEWEEAPSDWEGPFSKAIKGIRPIREKFSEWAASSMPHEEAADSFRGWEGTASRYYFEALAAFVPPHFQFKGRSKRPAYDPFNALINYLYGILYAYVELALMKAGIDPYNGVLHADQYKRPTLVYDCIESYRAWADETALRLVCQNELSEDCFHETEMQGVRIIQPGKSIAVETFLAFLNETISCKNQSRRRKTHIDLDALRLASRLKDFS